MAGMRTCKDCNVEKELTEFQKSGTSAKGVQYYRHRCKQCFCEKKTSRKKSDQLKMPFGTACNRLRKLIMFDLVRVVGKDVCHRCGKKIESAAELSIDHKLHWLDSDTPVEKFFDLGNVAFSHLRCNIGAGRRSESWSKCPKRYDAGCRCEACCEEMRRYHRENKRTKRNTPKERFRI